ncbi:MAG: carboxymuconolactone decarboxylase family protein [Patescibacteria group bacterium]
MNGLAKLSPELGDFLLEFVYGSVWSRSYTESPTIDVKTRALVTISCLASTSMMPQLKSHIGGALKVGVKKEEIIESLVHLSVYAGFPKAINALKVAQEVFKDF